MRRHRQRKREGCPHAVIAALYEFFDRTRNVVASERLRYKASKVRKLLAMGHTGSATGLRMEADRTLLDVKPDEPREQKLSLPYALLCVERLLASACAAAVPP
jgi:hypothetical protein